jgi:hypothetical protein
LFGEFRVFGLFGICPSNIGKSVFLTRTIPDVQNYLTGITIRNLFNKKAFQKDRFNPLARIWEIPGLGLHSQPQKAAYPYGTS